MLKDVALYLAVSIACTAIFIPAHIVAVRATGGTRLNTAVGLTAVLTAVVGAFLSNVQFGDAFSNPSAATVGCVGGALTFLGFAGIYTLAGPISVDRSVSVHLTFLLLRSPGQKMTTSELLAAYPHPAVLEKRFRDFENTGIVERSGDQLTLTAYGARISRAYRTLGSILGIRYWYLEPVARKLP